MRRKHRYKVRVLDSHDNWRWRYFTTLKKARAFTKEISWADDEQKDVYKKCKHGSGWYGLNKPPFRVRRR